MMYNKRCEQIWKFHYNKVLIWKNDFTFCLLAHRERETDSSSDDNNNTTNGIHLDEHQFSLHSFFSWLTQNNINFSFGQKFFEISNSAYRTWYTVQISISIFYLCYIGKWTILFWTPKKCRLADSVRYSDGGLRNKSIWSERWKHVQWHTGTHKLLAIIATMPFTGILRPKFV